MKSSETCSSMCSREDNKKKKMYCAFFCWNSCNTVTGVWKQQPRRSSPHGPSHTCTPPPPSLASPGPRLRSAGAQSPCELWMGRSVSRGTGGGGGGPPQTPLQMGQTGSCTGRNTACCALLPCRIRLLSHAGRMREREKRIQQYCLNFTSEGVKESSLCVLHHHRAGTSLLSEHASLSLPLKPLLTMLHYAFFRLCHQFLIRQPHLQDVMLAVNVPANHGYVGGRHV